MKDPYEVLGVPRTATDSEIKRAYHELVKKYHPDNYMDNPLADLASERMKEINEAYETITKSRAAGQGGASYGGYSGASGSGTSGGYTSGTGGNQFDAVRRCINANQLDIAENLLNSITNRTGEWYYLKGEIAYRRGWMDEARQNYQTACAMTPGNLEYQRALSLVQGGYTPYRQTNYQRSDLDDACNICNALLCLNCLCGGCGR